MICEADAEHQPRQIVMPLRRGEFMPGYSTEELLRGVCHIVKGMPGKRVIEPRPEVCKTRPSERFDTVKKMLMENKSTAEIAVAIQVSTSTISRYISRSPELIALSFARPGQFRNKGDESLARFREQEAEIRLALKTEALWSIAKRLRFCRRILKRHLENTKP